MLKFLSLSLQKLRAMAGGYLFAAAMLALAFLMFLTVRLTLNSAGPDSLSLAYVDDDAGPDADRFIEMLRKDDSAALSLTRCEDIEAARKLMNSGRAEGTLVIEAGFAALLAKGDAAVAYYPAAGSSSADAAREIISGHAVAVRSALRAKQYAEQLFSRELTETERNELERLTDSAMASAGSSVNVRVVGSGKTAAAKSIFSALYARSDGFFAFVCMLLLLMLGAFIGSGDARASATRMLSLRGGAANETISGLLALILFGLAAAVLYHAAFGLPKLIDAAAELAYIVCVSTLSMLLGKLAGAARAELASPFIALITSLAGGCFIDPDALGGALKTVSLFTPQGQLLAARGSISHVLILLSAAAVLLVFSLPIFGRRKLILPPH